MRPSRCVRAICMGALAALCATLAAYASRVSAEAIPEDYAVRFFDYDRTVNHRP